MKDIIDAFEQSRCAADVAGRLGAALAGQKPLQPDVICNTQVIEEIPRLHEHTYVARADRGSRGLRPAAKTKAFDLDMPAVRLVQAGKEVQKRGFSAAGGTEEGNELTPVQRQCHPS